MSDALRIVPFDATRAERGLTGPARRAMRGMA